jgi:hypothetical protein
MNIKTKLNEIRSIVFGKQNFEEDDVTYVEAKTVDGKIFRTVSFNEGNKIQEITEDGPVDIAPGNYEMEGDIMVTVSEESTIVSVEAKEVEEEMEEVTVDSTQVAEQVDVVTEEVVSQLLDVIDAISSEMDELKENFNKFKGQGSAEPTKTKIKFKKDTKKTANKYEARLQKYAEKIANNRK